MKKTSPSDHESFADRIRSWARTKAHGPSPLSKDSSRSPTLPLSHSPSESNGKTATATTPNDSSSIPPYASTARPGLAQSTSNHVGDKTPNEYPPPAPPPQVDGSGSVIEDTNEDEAQPPDIKKKNVFVRFWLTTKSIVLSSWINVLLVFVPVGIAAKAANLSPGLIFGMNAIAIVPLAGLLSHATESVAKRMGDAVGALMNITFGNAVELIIFIALSKNEIRIVQASLLGSILANLLLILGMCFLLGGLRFREQVYNSTVTQMSACLLSLSVMSLLLPTAFHASFSDDASAQATSSVLKVSRGTSVVLLIVYGMYLLFQLKSHAYMYESTPQHIIDEESAPGPVAQWMESSDDSSSSSSDSDSDTSSGSNTTAKRVKRLMRGGRRRRKSSAGSKDTGEPSTGHVSPEHTDLITEEPQTMGIASQHHDFGAEDADDEHKADEPKGRSRRGSHGSLVFSNLNSHKERRKERKRRRREKREARRERKRALQDVGTITEGTATNEKADDPSEPRRVDFAVADEEPGPLPSESPQKRARRLRPTIPKTFSQNVFTQPAPTPSSVPVAGTVPRVRVGLRRTNSLPDRLNQMPARTDSAGLQASRSNMTPVPRRETENATDEEDDDENISRTTAVFLLLASTGLVAICAEFMVDSIDAVVEGQAAISEAFIGLIILPIVGNAAEHVTAVTVATKNKMDLAIGVAVGSSIQIALFVTPFIVLLGWCMDKDMSLYFTLFETVSLFVSAFIVNFLVLDGRSNYLEGSLLCAAYIIIAVAAFFYPDSAEQSNLGGNADASTKMIRDLVGGALGF